MKLPVVLLLSCVHVGMAWVNDYHKDFTFQCPSGQSISKFASEHSNTYEDRLYDMKCHSTPGLSNCQWTGYENWYQGKISYKCHGVISGIISVYDNTYQDRRFKFYCCSSTGFYPDCVYNYYRHQHDKPINFDLRPVEVLTAFFSEYSTTHRDRIWKIGYCYENTSPPWSAGLLFSKRT